MGEERSTTPKLQRAGRVSGRSGTSEGARGASGGGASGGVGEATRPVPSLRQRELRQGEGGEPGDDCRANNDGDGKALESQRGAQDVDSECWKGGTLMTLHGCFGFVVSAAIRGRGRHVDGTPQVLAIRRRRRHVDQLCASRICVPCVRWDSRA